MTDKKPLISKKKMTWVIAGIVILLILFLFFSSYFTDTAADSGEDLNSGLERKLSAALSEMQGVGKVKVVISYESTAESVPASAGTEELFSAEPLILKQNLPRVRGVLVVAEGAEDIRIRTELMYAVTALLDVSPDRVEILY